MDDDRLAELTEPYEVAELSEKTSRYHLKQALLKVNAEAMNTHPSPTWDNQHAFMNKLLEWIAGR